MAISVQVRNKALNRMLQEKTTLYVSVPTVNNAPGSADLPRAEIVFNQAGNGEITNANSVQIAVGADTTVDVVYISIDTLTNETADNNVLRIPLTGEDVEIYNENGIYLIGTITIGLS